jgi:2-dehydro-3-deoxyphosphogluconate aldolase / (4S)-4-hydroxy-2-oxoglutarate aldolase
MTRSEDVRTEIERRRVIAIVRRDSAAAAQVDARAIIAGGITVVEISLADGTGLEAIRETAMGLPEGVRLGAGTVRSEADARAAVAAGGRFLVSPHLVPEVLAWARAHDVLYIPGVFTATELAAALDAGAELVKLFPAGRLGPGYVRDLLGPFPSARLVPTGGINDENAQAFLDAGAVAVAVGSALAGGAHDRGKEESAARLVELTKMTIQKG